MKELILSAVEREFILKAIGERKRLDGRQAYDVRRMNIRFGVDSGCCIVDLGDTKVMCDSTPSHEIVCLIQCLVCLLAELGIEDAAKMLHGERSLKWQSKNICSHFPTGDKAANAGF